MKNNSFSFRQIASGVITPLILILVAVGGYFVIIPEYKKIARDNDILKAKQEEARANRQLLENLKQMVDDYAKKQSALAVVNNVIPTAPEIPELLANFDYLAKQSGASIASLRITLPKSESGKAAKPEELETLTENLGILKIELGLSGKYPNIKAFFSNLEQNGRLMDVKTLNFQPVDELTGVQVFLLKIDTYYQKQ